MSTQAGQPQYSRTPGSTLSLVDVELSGRTLRWKFELTHTEQSQLVQLAVRSSKSGVLFDTQPLGSAWAEVELRGDVDDLIRIRIREEIARAKLANLIAEDPGRGHAKDAAMRALYAI